MIGTDQKSLTHVGDIEQSHLVAGMIMLPQYPERVTHRHIVTGERHHFGAKLDM